jgi:hypothetical protein
VVKLSNGGVNDVYRLLWKHLNARLSRPDFFTSLKKVFIKRRYQFVCKVRNAQQITSFRADYTTEGRQTKPRPLTTRAAQKISVTGAEKNRNLHIQKDC